VNTLASLHVHDHASGQEGFSSPGRWQAAATQVSRETAGQGAGGFWLGSDQVRPLPPSCVADSLWARARGEQAQPGTAAGGQPSRPAGDKRTAAVAGRP